MILPTRMHTRPLLTNLRPSFKLKLIIDSSRLEAERKAIAAPSGPPQTQMAQQSQKGSRSTNNRCLNYRQEWPTDSRFAAREGRINRFNSISVPTSSQHQRESELRAKTPTFKETPPPQRHSARELATIAGDYSTSTEVLPWRRR